MYTALLATMLAAGTTPGFHHHRSSCSACTGCTGYTSCSTCCYTSCSTSCHGCHGSTGHRHFLHRLFHHHHSCSHCVGCTTPVIYSCSGCSVCSGCCFQSYPVVPVPHPVAAPPVHHGHHHAYHHTSPVVIAQVTPTIPPAPPVVVAQAQPSQPGTSSQRELPTAVTTQGVAHKTARVTVTVPEQARLWVDQAECPLTSAVRSFNTPPLEANQQFYYHLKVEVVRDGRTLSETQRVGVTAGQEVRVDFNQIGIVQAGIR